MARLETYLLRAYKLTSCSVGRSDIQKQFGMLSMASLPGRQGAERLRMVLHKQRAAL